MSLASRLYLGVVIAAGHALLGAALVFLEIEWSLKALAFLGLTVSGSLLKIRLPGITGTMSVYFLCLLIAMTQLGLAELLLIGVLAVAVQCFWHAKKRPNLLQLAFNVSANALAVWVAHGVYNLSSLQGLEFNNAVRLALMSLVYFALNTGLVAVVVGLTERKSVWTIWRECYFWCCPYYLLGASVAGFFDYVSARAGWPAAMLALPVFFVIYASYRLYLGRLEDEKDHAQDIAALHLRTIEALALAIDAKDHTTHEHLRRVQVYATEIGKLMQVEGEEMEALEAAALLHDIGKLAVPEHIISKPGKLTPAEFEKMKIHPVVGAEILERVQFPYPVVPIVRCHHERWDGTGYPGGLKGADTPIGARILSAVDCLDALASDRPYRPALPLEEAVEYVRKEAGKSFDPQVAGIIASQYRVFESIIQSSAASRRLANLSHGVKVERGDSPAAGYQPGSLAAEASETSQTDFLKSIAGARQEAQALFELAQALGSSLSLSDTLSVLAGRLTKLVPYNAMAVYVLVDGRLRPEFVTGEEARFFSSLEIPIGAGISGWVAQENKPIVNATPAAEAAYLGHPHMSCKLNSAVAVPLATAEGVVGVLALYGSGTEAFSGDQCRVLQAVASKLGNSIENAMKYRQAESSATTDYLTSLPNARSLFLHLDQEVHRSRRGNLSLAIIVCDLDGFKQVNDRFGHLMGNEVLTEVAGALRGACREYDYVARMGGDEFVIVMPGIPQEAALAKLESFDRLVIEASYRVCGERVVSLSAGLAMFPSDGTSAEDLLAEGDRRMYRHKQERKQTRTRLKLPLGRTGVISPLLQ